jgi:dihydroneopterin aldolase
MTDDRDDLSRDEFEEELLDDAELGDDSELGNDAEALVAIEVTGLSLYTSHGVTEAERETGQRLVFDVVLELEDCDARITDRVEDTIDYADVCEQVALAAQERSYRTLERLCEATAERLLGRYDAVSVKLRATKPEPPIALPVEKVSVEVLKER